MDLSFGPIKTGVFERLREKRAVSSTGAGTFSRRGKRGSRSSREETEKAGRLSFRSRPAHASFSGPRATKNDPGEKDPVEVNVVRVEEIEEEDPAQEDPVQWVLLTTEPLGGFKKALRVVDYYRARWTIEEWHKALKTGCRIEDRQLETWERMEVLLSICSVIGWKVLQLRHLARGRRVPPDFFLTDAERAVLKEKYPELGSQGGKDWAIAVAKIGGYLDRSSDPPPGWQTLWKGLKKVQTWAEGYKLRSSGADPSSESYG